LVHPYLARRAGREPGNACHPDLEPVLSRTLGVPLFQEQMLQIAMVMGDFSGAEAEELRRALSFHRSADRMQRVSDKLRARMQAKGHSQKVMDEITRAISSFALYGFPESHAISFAHLAYASAYLKAHRAPEFYASLLNNQPMGFYSSASLVKDGQRHGVKFRPVCVAQSEWDCIIERDAELGSVSANCNRQDDDDSNGGDTSSGTQIKHLRYGRLNTCAADCVRLGLRVVRGLSRAGAERLLIERNKQPFASLDDFKRRVRLNKDELRTLAELGALNCFAAHRREALWHVETELREGDLFDYVPETGTEKSASPLAPMNYPERIRADFTSMQMTTGAHPMALVRPRLRDVWRAVDLPKAQHGSIVRIAGNVICRQRPGTAKGFVFISLEDETGISNAIVTPAMFEAQRLLITEEPFLLIEGRLQHVDNVIHVKAQRIERLPHEACAAGPSHDFH
jgi:error-prone DNA polymerase